MDLIQARWALLFKQFNFHLSYQLGLKNINAVALSRQLNADTPQTLLVPVLPGQLRVTFTMGTGRSYPSGAHLGASSDRHSLWAATALITDILWWIQDFAISGNLVFLKFY